MRKVCKICGIEKEITEYHKQGISKDGYRCVCKKCRTINEKNYYEDNKEKCRENGIKYRKEHSEKIKKHAKKYYEDNKEKDKEKRKKYEIEHKEERKERGRVWILNNPDKVKEKRRKHYEKHREEIIANRKQLKLKNKYAI